MWIRQTDRWAADPRTVHARNKCVVVVSVHVFSCGVKCDAPVVQVLAKGTEHEVARSSTRVKETADACGSVKRTGGPPTREPCMRETSAWWLSRYMCSVVESLP